MTDENSIRNEIARASELGDQLEELVYRGGDVPADDCNVLLLGYLALLFDYHRGIMQLLSSRSYGSAFALVRSVVEALVRAHLVVRGLDDDVRAIREDKYRVNFATIGPEIDATFGLGGLFENFMKSREALHSYTHSGVFQIARRFQGRDLRPSYESGAILEVIRFSTSAVFMVTNLVTKHLKFEDSWKLANDLYVGWGKR